MNRDNARSQADSSLSRIEWLHGALETLCIAAKSECEAAHADSADPVAVTSSADRAICIMMIAEEYFGELRAVMTTFHDQSARAFRQALAAQE